MVVVVSIRADTSSEIDPEIYHNLEYPGTKGNTCHETLVKKIRFLIFKQIYSAGKAAEFSQKVNSFIKILPPSMSLSLCGSQV